MRWFPFAFFVSVAVSGCGASVNDDLQAWMQSQRAETRPRVSPIPAPKRFVPQAYTEERSVDPFSSQKLTQALRNEMGHPSNSALISVELNRRKEALEYFPLDTMVMVGSLIKKGLPIALVKADNLLYQVKVGSYIGQNYGKVIKVSETEMNLREIVQDASGEWIERPTTLQLQEGTK